MKEWGERERLKVREIGGNDVVRLSARAESHMAGIAALLPCRLVTLRPWFE